LQPACVKKEQVMDWRTQLGAIRAIFMRDLKHYIRYPVEAVFGVLQPFIWLIPVYFMAQAFAVGGANAAFAAYSGTPDYVTFWLIGGILGFYVSSVLWGMGFSLKREMLQGVLEANWLTPVPVVVQLVGRSLWGIAVTTFKSFVGLAIVGLVVGLNFNGFILPALITVVLTLVGLYGLGFGIAAAVLVSNDASNIIDITDFAVTTLSGQQFPITVLPRGLMAVSLALPITYGIDAIRGYLMGTTTLLPLWQEQLILFGVMIVFVTVGYVVFRRVERAVRRNGNLAYH